PRAPGLFSRAPGAARRTLGGARGALHAAGVGGRDRPPRRGVDAVSTVLATGADERYGYQLVNLLGSVRANSDLFDEPVAFDLGLSDRQRRLLDDVPGVTVRSVPPFVPHWREGRTWKTWIWTHLDAERLVWLDAGLTVLRPLDGALRQIDELGYFVVSQG